VREMKGRRIIYLLAIINGCLIGYICFLALGYLGYLISIPESVLASWGIYDLMEYIGERNEND